MHIVNPALSCQVTAWEVQDSERPNDPGARRWIAKAIAQIHDSNKVVEQLSPEGMIITGEVIRIVEGRSFADSEAAALKTALETLLYNVAVIRGERPSNF